MANERGISYTDCRDEVGVTVGLIDGIIAMMRVLAKADLSSPDVQEALKDLFLDEDVRFVLSKGKDLSNGGAWKDHMTAALVNDLRDCAVEYASTGQLRERISAVLAPVVDKLKGP